MSEAHCELIVAGVIARDSLQKESPATDCELVIGGAIAQGVLDLSPSSPHQGEQDEQGDNASASDLIALSIVRRVQVQEQASASDSVQISVNHRIELLDTISAADSLQARQHASVLLLSAVFASDNVKAGQGVIYTAKTDSLAMSALVPEEDLNALAVVRGQLAASGSEGVYRLSGKPVAPFIQTGWLHPEGSALWRAESAYLQHSGEPLTLHLTVSDGDAQTYSYTSAPRNAQAPVPSKVKLGRGIRARAFRLGLSGADFVLDGGELVLNPLSRNV